MIFWGEEMGQVDLENKSQSKWLLGTEPIRL